MCRCRLCLQEKPLKESHIISKLFFKALKNKSEDNSFRDLSVPNRRTQDGIKVYLLCNDCEEKFSKYETYYSNRFLKKFSDENNSINTNDNYLRYFLLSLHWRLLVWKTLNDNIMMDNMNDSEKNAFFDVLELWRKALDSEDYDTIRSIRMRLIPTKKLEFIHNHKSFFLDSVLYDFIYPPEDKNFDFAISYLQVPNFIFICEVWGKYDKMKPFILGKKIKIPKSITFPKEILIIISNAYGFSLEALKKLTPKQKKLLLKTDSSI